MAPTQNSTLIHAEDNGVDRESSLEAVEKELSQYSPILARPAGKNKPTSSSPAPTHSKNAIKSTFTTRNEDFDGFGGGGVRRRQNTNGTSSCSTASSAAGQEEINEIPIWICGKPRFVSGVTNQTTCANIIEALIEDELQAMDGNIRDAALSHDLRDYVITERWRDVEQPLPGNTFILALWKAWGTKCATNEVKFKLRVNKWATSKGSQLEVATTASGQSERQLPRQQPSEVSDKDEGMLPLPSNRKHERKSDRMTAINKMMRKILKQGETIKQHLSQLTDNQAEVQRIEKLCEKIRQTKKGKKILMEQFINSANLASKGDLELIPLSSALTSEDEMFYMDHPILTDTEGEEKRKVTQTGPTKASLKDEDEEDDELFLVIENNDDLDSGVHFDVNKRSKSQMTEMQPICSSIELTEVLLETPKRKKRILRNFEELKRHSLTKQFTPAATEEMTKETPLDGDRTPILDNPDFKRTSLQFDTIRREIIVKMNDLKDLLQKEEDLIVNLESKCQKYKRENEIYGRKQGVQLKVDEIQGNLNQYAKEIVQHELDLYKTKLEIRENYLVLDDLKEMLAAKDPISGFGRSEFNRLVEKKFGLAGNQNNSECCPGNGAMAKQTPATTKGPLSVVTPVQSSPFNIMMTLSSPFVDNVYEFCDNNNDSIIV